MRRARLLGALVAVLAASSLVIAAPPALATDGAASGEAPPPSTGGKASARAFAAAAFGGTTRTTDASGRTVYRVEDGWDLDQYLGRGTLSFRMDVDQSYGPVDDEGHPAPGNALYDRYLLLTVRAWDVDEAQGERDDLRFNGDLAVPATLSGANDQWATDTFFVRASSLLLPTADNPTGTNTVDIDVDVTGEGWAVQVDWAELRPYLLDDDTPLPVVLAHGITDDGHGSARSGMWEIDDYLQATVTGLSGRTSAPPMTAHGSVRENALILADEIDELVEGEPVDQVNLVGHSMGGLGARLYTYWYPERVSGLVMIGTPNHGSEFATALCMLRMVGNDSVAPEFGPCDDQDDGLFELLPGFLDKFNEVVVDSPAVNYRTIAGRGGGNTPSGWPPVFDDGFAPGIPGEDDGTVSVESVRWLSHVAGRGGRQYSIQPTVDRSHMELIRTRGQEQPLSYAMTACFVTAAPLDFCPLSDDLDGTESTEDVMSARAALPADAAPVLQHGTGPAETVAPGGTARLPVDVVAGENATLTVLGDERLQLDLEGGQLFETDHFGVSTRSAGLQGPATLVVHNPTDVPLAVASLLGLESERTLTVTTPSTVEPGAPLTIDAAMTGTRPGEVLRYLVKDGDGAVVAEGDLAPAGTDRWTAEVASPEPGAYSVLVTTTGARARSTLDVVSVLGGASFPGTVAERTTDDDLDGLVDTLTLDVPVAVDAAGDYQLTARVLDAGGALVAGTGVRASLDAGEQTVSVSFDGRTIHDTGVEGPWHLDVVLADLDLDLRATAHLGELDNDDLAAFEHDSVRVDGFADEAADVDGDGLLDVLSVTATAHVDEPGDYALNGKLVAEDGTEVGRASTTVWLDGGAGGVRLDFDGPTIGASGEDGPYVLRDLAIYPTHDASRGTALVDAYRTAAYRSAQFPGGHSADAPPTAVPGLVTVDGYAVRLDASASTDDRGIVSFDWGLGDGTTATGPEVSHEYLAAGTYPVTLTVTDTAGQTATAVLPVQVTIPTCDGRVATVVGTGGSVIRGTARDDVIVGTAAAEQIDGGLGDDVICAGGGDDLVRGANGRDRLFGGAGQDRLEGGDGDDVLDGGAGADLLHAANGADSLVGGDGDDVLDGGDGDDTLSGGAGADVLTAANGADAVDAGDGDDVVTSGEGADVVHAGAGHDRVDAGGGDDVVHAGAGNDVVTGGEGADRLLGEEGDDVLRGQGGDDELDGGPGADVLDGGKGRNLLRDVP